MKKKEQKISVVETLNRISKSESGALSKVFELQQKESEEVCKKIAENNPLKSLLNIDFDKLRPHQPATKQDIKELLEKADKKNNKVIYSENELFFSRQGKQLDRYVGKKTISYKFTKGKRITLFEALFDNDNKFYTTEDLRKYLGCPSTNSVQKMVGEINSKAKINLGIKKGIIQGRAGMGYRINPDFKIHKS